MDSAQWQGLLKQSPQKCSRQSPDEHQAAECFPAANFDWVLGRQCSQAVLCSNTEQMPLTLQLERAFVRLASSSALLRVARGFDDLLTPEVYFLCGLMLQV